MAGFQDLVRASVVIAVDPGGKVIPVKNTKGPLTRIDCVESFIRSLDDEHRRMLHEACVRIENAERDGGACGEPHPDRGSPGL